MSTRRSTEDLNSQLKDMVAVALEPYSEVILVNWDQAADEYFEEVMPVYTRTSRLRTEVDKWYGSGIDEKDPVGWITELMHVISTMMVPEYARSEYSKEMISDTEAKDQCPNLLLRKKISDSIEVPLPVLAPAVFDEDTGLVDKVFDLVIEIEGESHLNSFGRAAILGLIQMGRDIPADLYSLLNPITGME